MSCCCGLCECPCTEIKVTLSGCVELAGEYILTPDPIYGSQCLFMFTDSVFNGSEYVTFTLKYNCRTNHFFISYGDSSCSDEGTLESVDPFEVSANCSLNCGGDLVSVFADITCNITACCSAFVDRQYVDVDVIGNFTNILSGSCDCTNITTASYRTDIRSGLYTHIKFQDNPGGGSCTKGVSVTFFCDYEPNVLRIEVGLDYWASPTYSNIWAVNIPYEDINCNTLTPLTFTLTPVSGIYCATVENVTITLGPIA